MSKFLPIFSNDAIIPLNYHPRELILFCTEHKHVALADLLANTDITPEQVDRMWHLISFNQYCQLIRNALALTNEASLGLQFGQRLSLGANGIIGFAFFTGNSVGDMLEMSTRLKKLISPITRIRYEVNERTLVIRGECTMVADELEAFYIETLFTTLTRWFQDVAPDFDSPFTYRFRHAPPPYADDYAKYLSPSKMTFDAPANEIICDASLMDISLKHSHAFAAQEALSMIADRVQRVAFREGFVGLIRDRLRQAPDNMPSQETMSDYFELSVSSFKRKLGEYNTSFQTLRNEVKKDIAIEKLQQGKETIEDIGQSLGYFSAANFRRAFKEWTGKTPSEYRNNHHTD